MSKLIFQRNCKTFLTCMALVVAWPALSARSLGESPPGPVLAASMAPIDPEFRLAAVGYRLAVANPAQCDNPPMFTGLMLHNIADYAPGDRAAATELYGLSGGFGVLQVVPDSAAERAGLAAGDEIVAVNGLDLKRFNLAAIRSSASFDRTAKFADYLESALAGGPANLVVRRQSATVDLRLEGQPGCGGRIALIRRGAADAWSDGRYVAVTLAMVDLAADDSELAFVVGHEMAHNIAHDAARKHPLGGLLLQFGFGAARVKQAEINADTVAITLMARAGFDLAAPEHLLSKAASSHQLDLAITHPGIARRITVVRQAIAARAVLALAGSQAGSGTDRHAQQGGMTIR